MNKKTIGIISSGLAATTLIVFFVAYGLELPQEQSQKENGLVPSDVPFLSIAPKIPVSTQEEAATKTSQKVSFPTYLPTGYKIQRASVAEDIKSTIIMASSQPITPETTIGEFTFKQKGITIYMEPLGDTFNEKEWTNLWIEDNTGRQITVNGFNGVISDAKQIKRFDETIDEPARLVLFKDGLMISLKAMLPSEELVKIAESL
ncbi:DUF4367 domain-containing protein [Candidatus Nitrosotenuis uzonensis]|nr:DUF4367 domain-containing protein [Candidatus Nitrosotenuis uzonensis]